MNRETKKIKKAIEQLKKIVIPDTRELQRIMIGFGIRGQGEKEVEMYSPQQYSVPRICLLPQEEQKRIFSLAIPMNFPDCLRFVSAPNPVELRYRSPFFEHWENGSYSPGVFITTHKNMPRLIDILVKNNIPIELDTTHCKIFSHSDSNFRSPAINVPYSYDATIGDGDGNHLDELQFTTLYTPIHAATYIALEERIVRKETSEESNDLSDWTYPSFETSRSATSTFRSRIYCDVTLFCPMFSPGPENYLQQALNDDLKEWAKQTKNERKHEGYKKETEKERISDARVKILHLGKPVVVYDPQWIETK